MQFFIRYSPAKDSGGIASSPMDNDYRQMLKDPCFWLLFVILAIISSSSAQIGMTQYGLVSGALVVSLVSIFNSVGRLFWGGIVDKLGSYNTLAVVYLFTCVCIFALP